MIRFYKYGLFILLVSYFSTGFKNLSAQDNNEFVFDRITSENVILQKGLSQNTVFCLLEDRQGYFWFGTWDGLNKWDGYNFTIYNKSNGLTNETINTILEDELGRIWVGTERGLNCIDRKTGKIAIYLASPNDSTALSDDWINYLVQDKPGRILICTNQGVNILDFITGKITKYQNEEFGFRNLRGNTVNYIFCDSKKNYWIGSNFGLLKYDPLTHENIRFLNRPNDFESLSSNIVNVIFEDKNNQIWIGTDNGLNLLNIEEGKFKVFLTNPQNPGYLGNNNINDIYEDSRETFWIATEGGGLNILEKATGKFISVQNQPKNQTSLSNNRVYDIYEDRDSNLWFGTFKGVSKIDRNASKFKLFTHDPDNRNSLSDNFIWAFCEVEHDIFWIGTDDGINIFDKKANTFKHLKSKYGQANTLSSSRVRCILKDSSGNLWIGLRDAGLDKFEPVTGKITNFSPSIQDHNDLCDLFVIALFEDSYGAIWIGTYNGLNIINPKTNQIRAYYHIPGDTTTIPNNTIYSIIQDYQGIIWMATSNGLCKYNREKDNFQTFFNTSKSQNLSVSDKLFCIYEDGKNDLWVGSRGGGLEKFDKQTKTFISFTTQDGLPNNVVYGILEDNHQNLWLSTNWGLTKFNKYDRTFINFDVTDGLQSNEFNSGAYLKSKSGELFFGGMKGFNSFFTDDIKTNSNIPEIAITAFKIFNSAQSGEIHHGDTVILSHDENFFSIEFSALDFTNPLKNKYSYILENYNKTWINVDGKKHFAEYTKVSPGTYIFKVKGSNNNGVWNNQSVSLTIIIKRPWFQTWFFRIAAFLFVLISVFSIIYLRFNIVNKKHDIEKKVLQIEKQFFEIQQKALRLQMNPHFLFNSLNSIQSFVLSNDVDLAVNYLGKFSQLMRLILTNSSESIISLASEMQAVKYYLDIEKLRFEDKFEYSIIIDPKIDEDFTGIPPMIIQPYVENAIIHGIVHKESVGRVDIEFKKHNDLILCTIQDDGIGRSKALEIKKKSGLNNRPMGMLITKERLEILNNDPNQKYSVRVTDLFDKNNNPCGTMVELAIKYHEI